MLRACDWDPDDSPPSQKLMPEDEGWVKVLDAELWVLNSDEVARLCVVPAGDGLAPLLGGCPGKAASAWRAGWL